jgi:hypothetical protein
MNSVESAASLFGSDAGPDPFAALGSDDAETTTTQSTTSTLPIPRLPSIIMAQARLLQISLARRIRLQVLSNGQSRRHRIPMLMMRLLIHNITALVLHMTISTRRGGMMSRVNGKHINICQRSRLKLVSTLSFDTSSYSDLFFVQRNNTSQINLLTTLARMIHMPLKPM